MIDLPSGTTAPDVIVVGTGVAGLTAALGIPPDRRVHLVTKTDWDAGGSSAWAQGGLAAAVGAGDAPERHAADTLAVGGDLGDPAVVAILTQGGPAAVARLIAYGARFDRGPDGGLALGREAAHSARRIVHAHGDATGAEIVRALSHAVHAAPHVAVYTRTCAWDVLTRGGRVTGVRAVHPDGRVVDHRAPAVVLATGGCGQAYRYTTNPPEVTGDGLAMAARAGARLADLEFVQFHPTALAVDADPLPLVTEALRGEGAVLHNDRGRRFMSAVHPLADMAPRDIVARAIRREIAAGRSVFLDARVAVGDRFPDRFPTVFAMCRRHGIDPRREPIPVVPAAHFHMGGVAVDPWGRTSLAGLWACGEVAATGAHGANRLASNSLLEALVFGGRVAEDVERVLDGEVRAVVDEAVADRATERDGRAAGAGLVLGAAVAGVEPVPDIATPAGAANADGREVSELRAAVRHEMWDNVGLMRDGAGLTAAVAALGGLAAAIDRHLERPARYSGETRNMALVGRLIAAAALAREESRGAHYRTDFPDLAPGAPRRIFVRWSAGGAAITEVEDAGAVEAGDIQGKQRSHGAAP